MVNVMDFFILQAFYATLFTWFMTALGASVVFIIKKQNEQIFGLIYGIGGGIMLAATFFSLLEPAITRSEAMCQKAFLIVSLGVLFGSMFIFLTELIIDKIKLKAYSSKIVLSLAITLHNIPEGLAIGVAFGSLAFMSNPQLYSAWVLAIGIGLQNFPEGLAISLPLKMDKMSSKKAFLIGQASGIVEPISGIIGAIMVIYIEQILPFVLSFAAGAMLYVVIKEIVPVAINQKTKIGILGFIIGFIIMMILDVALG